MPIFQGYFPLVAVFSPALPLYYAPHLKAIKKALVKI
jgi:hypothetical protein